MERMAKQQTLAACMAKGPPAGPTPALAARVKMDRARQSVRGALHASFFTSGMPP